jgi:folate-binding protein YgfZ
VSSGAVVYRRASRALLAVGGSDATSFLHGILTNDVRALKPGQACYAAYLTPQGRMLADMQVLRRPDDLWLDVEEIVREKLLARFEQSIFTEDVTVMDRSGAIVTFGVYGSASTGALADALSNAQRAPVLPGVDAHLTVELPESGHATVLGVSAGGVHGFHVFAEPPAADRLIDVLLSRGAAALGAEAAESLRVEAGVPRYGIDMTEDTIPLETGIEDRAISTTKGCYVGQEVIIRILHRGQGRVVRKLVGLRIEGNQVPGSGTRLLYDERVVGHVTSAVRSPRCGVIALGYVHREFLQPGTRLLLADDPGGAAIVAVVPFT